MKKIIALLSVVVMLTACGSKQTSTEEVVIDTTAVKDSVKQDTVSVIVDSTKTNTELPKEVATEKTEQDAK